MGFDVMKLIYSDGSALQSLLVNYFARIFLVEKLENTLCFDSEVAIGILFESLVAGPKLTVLALKSNWWETLIVARRFDYWPIVEPN